MERVWGVHDCEALVHPAAPQRGTQTIEATMADPSGKAGAIDAPGGSERTLAGASARLLFLDQPDVAESEWKH